MGLARITVFILVSLLAHDVCAKTLVLEGNLDSSIAMRQHMEFTAHKGRLDTFAFRFALPADFQSRSVNQSIDSFTAAIEPKPSSSTIEKDRFGNRFQMVAWNNLATDVRINLTYTAVIHAQLSAMESRTPFPIGSVAEKDALFLEPTELTQSHAPEIAELARRLTTGAKNEYDAVTAVINHVSDTIKYTFNPPQYDALYTLGTKSGNCQNFAHLTIALLRSVGIPARIVGGITLKDIWKVPINAESSIVQNMGQGGHAWMEVFFPDLGWLSYDPQQSRQFTSSRHIKQTHGLDSRDITDGWSGTPYLPDYGELIEGSFKVDTIRLKIKNSGVSPRQYVISNLVATRTLPVAAEGKPSVVPPASAVAPADGERLARLKAEKERTVKEKMETERLARERAEADRVTKLRADEERKARMKAEEERKSREMAEQARLASELAEAGRLAKLKAEEERTAQEKAEREHLAMQKAEEQRKAKEKMEMERLARERAEADRFAKLKAEEERNAREKVEQERLARERAEADRQAGLRATEERAAREKAENDRLARLKAEEERAAQEKLEMARLARERAEADRLATLKVEEEQRAREKAEVDRQARLKAEEERRVKEHLEKERLAKERAEADRVARVKAEDERKAREKAEAERLSRGKTGDGIRVGEQPAQRKKAGTPVVFGNMEFPNVVNSYTVSGNTGSKILDKETSEYVTSQHIYAQAFVLKESITLEKVSLAMRKFGGDGTVYVDLVKDDGGKPNILDGIRSNLVSLEDITRKPGYYWVDLSFPKDVQSRLKPGKYWIVFRYSGEAIMNWYYIPGKPYSDSDDTRSTAKGFQWEDILNHDFVFKVSGSAL
jgi:hypothetical protein